MTQTTANPKEVFGEIIEEYKGRENGYNPAADRRVQFYANAVSKHAINQGEELLDNYFVMCGASAE